MVKRVLLIGLLGVSLIALIGNEVSARVCILKNSDGSCKYWSGSVECEISATGVGNVTQDPVTLACTATGTDNWIIACGNNGSNIWTAPGINVINFSGQLSGLYELTVYDVDQNGRAYGTAYATIDNTTSDDLIAAGACPNSNWSVVDAVPCTMEVTDKQLNADNCVTSDATYSCTLPSCETLSWDSGTQMFERRQYDCTLVSVNNYKDPICPP
jgi:hypothetical protein